MTHDVTLADLQEQHTAVVRAEVPHDGIAEFLGGTFGEVIGVISAQGLEPSGMPFGRYRPLEGGGWDIEAGFPVPRAIEPAGRVQPSTLPGGHAARVMHRGAYDAVAGAYEAAMAWVVENGFAMNGDPWECYLDGPEVAEPRTEIFVPCAEAHH